MLISAVAINIYKIYIFLLYIMKMLVWVICLYLLLASKFKKNTPWELFQNAIETSSKEEKLISLAHHYMITHCPAFVQALQ